MKSNLDQNEYIKRHFKQRTCSFCHNTIIQIDGDWFEIRLHLDEGCRKRHIENAVEPSQCCIKTEILNTQDEVHPNLESVQQEEDTNFENGKISSDFHEFESLPVHIEISEGFGDVTEIATDTPVGSIELSGSTENKSTANEPTFDCHVCEKTYDTKNKLTRHQRYGHKATIFDCKLCNKQFHNRKAMQSHADVFHEGKSYSCDTCGKQFKKNFQLTDHKVVHSDQPPSNCTICGKVFKVEQRLRAHMSLHTEKNKCDICNKSFASASTLKSHREIIHEGKSLYACDICGKSFANSGNLGIHKRTHSSIRPFICDICGNGFNAKFTLTEHLNTHTGNKPYVCKICNKAFFKRVLLEKHNRIHTQDKRYKCKLEGCDRAYIHLIDLKRHLYGQHGIYTKKHVCSICSKVYPENKLLKKHMESH